MSTPVRQSGSMYGGLAFLVVGIVLVIVGVTFAWFLIAFGVLMLAIRFSPVQRRLRQERRQQ